MATAKITLIGFYNYMKDRGTDLFSNLSLPSGIDRDTVINNILLQGGEFEVLYGDPYFLQSAIDIWSKKWNRTFQKWYDALQIEYDPLYNYDRTEIIDNIRTEGEKTKRSEVAFGNDHSTSSGNGETENTRSAYDASTYQPHDKNTSSSSGDNLSDSLTSAMGDTSRNTDTLESHKARMFGNIGVTTSQQMLSDQLDIVSWNLYEHITDLFLKEFCIWIY